LRSVELSVLGPLEARGPSGPIALPRAKERALLAALALFHGRVVSKDRLADAVWADWPPAQAQNVLRTHVHRLRSALGDGVIETHSAGYALAPGVVVDIELFETEVTAADSRQNLRAALGRWKGDPYVDLGEWTPAELERTRLAELRDGALETYLALEIEAGEAAGCIAELEALVAETPLRERRWFLLMKALSGAGRVADALRAYQRARKVFAEELGIDPGPELRDLEERILLDDIGAARHGNLPRQMTSFVGRERELAQLVGLVRERSLVTLTGVGGVGKTRLALQVAAEVTAEFPDGAWLCELAPVADPGAVWNALAASLGVRPAPGRNLQDLVLEYLAAKRLLLLFDNCEHLLVAVAKVVAAIEQRCPRVAVLATSREGLAVAGEQIFAVPSLTVPEVGADEETIRNAEALRLFCGRAREANSDFLLGEGNLTAVVELCRRLDGLPLALELAAARTLALAPDDLVVRLDQRFKLLTRGSRNSLERHQTLRTTIDWSYDLLTDEERSALSRVAAFVGGCDLAAAETVLAGGDLEALDVARLLGQLVDKSLVIADHRVGGTRYRLLETIREYAQERLESTGETAAVRRRHMDHYVSLAETAAPHLRNRDQLTWAAVLDSDVENLRAAFDFAVERSLPEPGLRLVASLAVAGLPIGWTAMGWAHTAATIPGAHDHQLFPLVVAYAATDAAMNGQLEAASALVETAEAAQTALDTNHPYVYTARGVLALFSGDLEGARHHAEVVVETARATGDPYEIVAALTMLAGTLANDPARGLVTAQEAVQLARDAGLVSWLGLALTTQFMYIDGRDDPALELAMHEEMIGVASALGDQQLLAIAVASRESTRARQGDWRSVLRAIADAAVHFTDHRHTSLFVESFWGGAIAFTALEQFEPGAVLFGFSEAHSLPTYNDEGVQLLAATETALLDALKEENFSDLKARGGALDLPEAVAYLRTEADRALVEKRP
jgi:predicted ATPase/DNA-binding SARP family transcriptional activator